MFRKTILAAALLAILPTAAFAEDAADPAPSAGLKPESFLLFDRLKMERLRVRLDPPERVNEPATDAGSSIFLSHRYRMEDMFRPVRRDLSRFDCTVKGIGAGAKLALFAGALANEFGGRNDELTWYMLGAGAAAGALLGGTIGSESSRWNVGYEWEP